MDENTKRLFDAFSDTVGLLISVATLILAYIIYKKGIIEYHDTNKTKRAEFLEKLIESFNADSLTIAKQTLDDFVFPTGLKFTSETYYSLPCVNFVQTLRDHTKTVDGITDDTELQIRASFSALLDFFSKLSYYLSNELITKKELGYFKYYIDRINYIDSKSVTRDSKSERLRKDGIKIFVNTYFDSAEYEKLFAAVK
jgi:hypothetical protein